MTSAVLGHDTNEGDNEVSCGKSCDATGVPFRTCPEKHNRCLANDIFDEQHSAVVLHVLP